MTKRDLATTILLMTAAILYGYTVGKLNPPYFSLYAGVPLGAGFAHFLRAKP